MTAPIADVAIVGAGIAGASMAWQLAPTARVLLLERESQPGYHATGRSAAMFMQSYGPPQARALTRASRAFYLQPPPGFAATPLLAPRGVLYVAWLGQQAQLDALEAGLRSSGAGVRRVDAAEALRRVPVLRAEGLLGALAEPDAMDIDVHALHQGFLRGARRAGAELLCDAELIEARRSGAHWTLTLRDGRRLAARTLVDAAGAWADDVARCAGMTPLGLQPRRRSAFTLAAPEGVDCRGWPAVVAVDESWYLKPDAGQLLGSPANADPVPPHDVVPEEIDIARGIAAIEAATTLRIRRPQRTWAGLRTFAPDGELVIGWDDAATAPMRQPVPGAAPVGGPDAGPQAQAHPGCGSFFWLAGQGGYGIQSAAAAGALAAALWRGEPLPTGLREAAVDAAAMAPARLRAAGAAAG